MHLQCGTLQKKQVLTCLASPQKSGFWQPIHLGLSLLHNVLKPRGFLCCCVFFFFVVVVVSAGLLSALCLPGSLLQSCPHLACRAEPSVIFIYSLQSAITPDLPKGNYCLNNTLTSLWYIYIFFTFLGLFIFPMNIQPFICLHPVWAGTSQLS